MKRSVRFRSGLKKLLAVLLSAFLVVYHGAAADTRATTSACRTTAFSPGRGEETKYASIESLKDAVVTQSGSVQKALYRQQIPAYKEF